jgi:hypothetical protein
MGGGGGKVISKSIISAKNPSTAFKKITKIRELIDFFRLLTSIPKVPFGLSESGRLLIDSGWTQKRF